MMPFLFVSGHDISTVQREVEADLNKIFEWDKVCEYKKKTISLCLKIRMHLDLHCTFALIGTRLMIPITLNSRSCH